MKIFSVFSGVIHVASIVFILSSNEWIWYPSLPGRNRQWMWAGSVTNESFAITTRGYRDKTLDVYLSSNETLLVHQSTIQNEVERIDINGLEPETSYTYRVGDNEIGRIRTFASFVQSKLRVGFGSCSTSGSTSSAFSELANQNLDLFIHLGDMHYEDISVNDSEKFLDAFDIVHASSEQTKLFRSSPFVYMYDDHDFGPNDSDMTSPSRDAAISNYRRCIPHYPLEKSSQNNDALYHAFTIGRVRFVVPDLKSEMMNDASIMSSTQMDWFLSEIRNSYKYTLVVLVLGIPWTSNETGWGSHIHDRSNISSTILETYRSYTSSSSLGGHANIIGVAGDAHIMAFDDGTNSEGHFPIVQAAPLDRIGNAKGGVYSSRYLFIYILSRHKNHIIPFNDDNNNYTDVSPTVQVTMSSTTSCFFTLCSNLSVLVYFGHFKHIDHRYAIMEISDSGTSGPESICIDLELRRAGVSNAMYETSFCGPLINSAQSSNVSKKCEIDLFPMNELLEMIFFGLFLVVVTLIVIVRCVWKCCWSRGQRRCRFERNHDDGIFLLWNLMLGYVWIGITLLILYVGLLHRNFRTNSPVHLARTGLVVFVPLTILFMSVLILGRNVKGQRGTNSSQTIDGDLEVVKLSKSA